MQHAGNLHAVINRAVEDHIPAERNAVQACDEFIARSADQRVQGEPIALGFQPLHEPGRVGRTGARDEVPDLG
jgi:hypothetical protein